MSIVRNGSIPSSHHPLTIDISHKTCTIYLRKPNHPQPSKAPLMNNTEDKGAPPSVGLSALQTLIGGFIFCLVFLVIWLAHKGVNFFTAYASYACIALIATLTLGLMLPFESAARKRFPTLFERLPEPSLQDTLIVTSVVIMCSIIVGIMDGWITGMLIFWPAVIITSFVSHAIRWIMHHTTRWIHHLRK